MVESINIRAKVPRNTDHIVDVKETESAVGFVGALPAARELRAIVRARGVALQESHVRRVDVRELESCGQKCQADYDPSQRRQQQLPPADALHQKQTNKGAEKVDGCNPRADPNGL